MAYPAFPKGTHIWGRRNSQRVACPRGLPAAPAILFPDVMIAERLDASFVRAGGESVPRGN